MPNEVIFCKFVLLLKKLHQTYRYMYRLAQWRYKQLFFSGIFVFCSFMFTSSLQAQDWSFAVGPGVTTFIGDASEQRLSRPGFALNAEAWYYLNDNFRIKSGLSFYNIRANDPDSTRLRDFDASNIEVYTSLMYYFPVGLLKPFAYAGIGFTTNNPMGPSRIGEWDLRTIEPEATAVPGLVGIVPMGLGLEYEITPVLSLVADLSVRYAFSDQLDAIGREIIRTEDLGAQAVEYYEALSDNVGRAAREQETIRGGSSSQNDMYGMFSLKVKFTPTASIFGCIDPYKYQRPARKRKRRSFDPI